MIGFFLISAAIGITSHALLSRATGRSISSIAFSAVISLAFFWTASLIVGSAFPETLGWSLALVFGCELYVFLVTLSQGSVSSNILVLLLQKPLRSTDIDALYDSRKMVLDRIERLEQSGLIASAGTDTCTITPLGLSALRKLSLLDCIFGHKNNR